MRGGAIDGLSIGFRTVRGRTDAKTGMRQLIEVDLWEVSVVTFPMLPAARVSSVKTHSLIETIRRAARTLQT
jgi:HK97 family phage prohead protease